MMSFKSFLLKRRVSKDRKAIQDALNLQNRGEARCDGRTLTQASHHLKIEWRARDVSARTRLGHRGVTTTVAVILGLALGSGVNCAQSQTTTAGPEASASTTSTDLFVMIGSDFDRPGLLPRANYNIGIGHTFGFLKKDPIGDELTFGYTYENAGTHGFLHSAFGEHTESAGVMKNFSLPKTKSVTGYTWLQSGITSYTGNTRVQNRLDSGLSLGAIVHCNNNNSIWIQESYNKVVTVPWYTTSSIGYTYSW